ncbi:MAG: pyrimidine 5'-nucleotidase [Anaerolineae bacterium]|nr:pyrimidine 5'-nucleotidase [Anaerolineae bacterium]
MSFTHILFDLDNTLYPRETGLLRELDRRIQQWTEQELGLTAAEATAMRKDYFVRYGTTLSGLVAEWQVDVEDYLAFVHDVQPARYLRPDPALAAMLRAIPLCKVVFTNAPAEHARRVLDTLGVADRFERLLDIRAVGMCSKPRPAAYDRALALLDARGPACIMVEDNPANLRPAKALGMTTVLVGAPLENGVDFARPTVLDVGPLVAQWISGDGP